MKASLVCDGTPDCPEPDDESDEDCRKLFHRGVDFVVVFLLHHTFV